MPTYVYRREDGTTFEIDQRITEDALTVCPTTGQPVSRIITGTAGLIFKGTGFYETDYVRKKRNGDDKPTPTTKKVEAKEKPAAKKTETTSASS